MGLSVVPSILKNTAPVSCGMVTFTEETLNGKLHFLCIGNPVNLSYDRRLD